MRAIFHFITCGFRNALDLYIRFTYVYFSRFPIIVFYIIGAYYTWRVLANFAADSTPITNVAFGISTVFSGLCFRWSSTLDGTDEEKKRVAYSGERFLHASMLLVLASVIKYAGLAIGLASFDVITKLSQFTWLHCLTSLIGVTVSVLFFYALTFAHTGMIFINRILWKRVAKYSDWDSWV